MTPPATKPAASASVSADAQVEGPQVPSPDAENTATEEQDPKQWVWRLAPGFATERQGGRNGGLFAIDNISQFGDFFHFDFSAAVMRDLAGNKVRFRLGPYAAYDGTFGNENSSGSNLHSLTLGPRAELDWSRVYKGGLGGILEGPGVLGIHAGLGYGWGTTNVDGGFQLHSQSGLATAVGADLNLLRFNIGNVAIDLGPKFSTTSIYGSDFNNAGINIGGFIAIRPSTKKMTVERIREVNRCDDDVTAIARQEQKVKDLRQQNEDLTQLIGELRFYLEAHPKHPFTSANMRKYLVIGAVAESLNNKKVEAAKIAAFVQEANKPNADFAKLAEVAAAKAGVADADAQAMVSAAQARYPEGHDFWKAPDDPNFELKPDMPKNPEDCPDIQQYRDDLEEVIGKLERRQGALEKLYETAVHLAGLALGAEEAKEILAATIINVDTPSFKTARPNAADIAKLNGGTSVDTIAGQVFSSPKFEMDKLDKLAAWLKGEGDLPGEERTKAILNDEFKKKGQVAFDESPEAKKAFREWVKNLNLGIFGHTDSDGSDKANEELSQRRADFIKAYLVSRGVSADRLTAKGFGERYPAMPETGGNHQERLIAKGKNRRVEFVPVGVGGPITPERGTVEGHVDSKEVPKDEGGTKGGGPNPALQSPAPKPATPAPKPATPAPKPGAADW